MAWLTLVFGIALAAPLTAAPPLEPAKGVFLVARPAIDGGPFHRSVVLLLYHDDRGTLGVIVNRPTDIPIQEAVPGLDIEDSKHELYFGGPVGLGGLLFVFEQEDTPEQAHRVLGGIHFSGNGELLSALVEEEAAPDALSLFIGHAGWSPGQLDREILEGSWDVVPADRASIFEKDRDTLWRELSKGGRLSAGLRRPAAKPFRGIARVERGDPPARFQVLNDVDVAP